VTLPLRARPLLAALLLSGLLSACTPTIAPFSARASEMAVDIKVDASRVIERAEEPFDRHRVRIEALQVRMQKATEYAKGRPRNEHSSQQWALMGDPDGFLLGGFLARWEAEDSLSYAFIVEARSLIDEGFDAIIGLESGKVGSNRK
jgi:hypothetical protein